MLLLKAFVTSTESTRRVQAWHEMIQPRLKEAESRRDFDIHLYGSRILNNFETDSSTESNCSFAKIVSRQPKNEVARYFLATLQLVIVNEIVITQQRIYSFLIKLTNKYRLTHTTLRFNHSQL